MTYKFLKAKHWKIFLISFVIPFAIHFVLMGLQVVSSSSSNMPNFSYSILMPINFILFGFFLLGWLWPISVSLQKHIPDNIKMKTMKFKIFFTIKLKRKVSFYDFAEEFFLLWFYPIEIWIIQPKINSIINE